MQNFTADTLTAHLIRTFGGHAVTDTDERGRTVLNFHIANPTEPRHSIALVATVFRGSVHFCSLRFGQAEISPALAPDDLTPAINAILSGQITAVVRYKNRDAYDDRRRASHGRAEWLYRLSDDAEAYEHMLKKLGTPANVWEKLMGTATGVYEVYDWETSAVYER